jgi:WD40 repeat protein
MIPNGRAETTIYFKSSIYSGQFSDDGSFFYACGHDFRVRMYDTSNPYDWRHYKTVSHPYAQWTLTDASLSPDNKWLAYCSLTPAICLAPTDLLDEGDPYHLDLSGDSDGPNALASCPSGSLVTAESSSPGPMLARSRCMTLRLARRCIGSTVTITT